MTSVSCSRGARDLTRQPCVTSRLFEEPPVPAQDDSSLGARVADDRVIREVVCPGGVEPGHAKEACELSQVDVRNEPGLAQGCAAHSGNRGDVPGFEHGVHAHAVTLVEAAGEIRRLAVDQDEVDLGVRHSKTLDQGLGRASLRHFDRECPSSLFSGEELVELRVQPNGTRWASVVGDLRAGQRSTMVNRTPSTAHSLSISADRCPGTNNQCWVTPSSTTRR